MRISYVQPALRAAQPSRVRLKIAPIDVIYSQACPSPSARYLKPEHAGTSRHQVSRGWACRSCALLGTGACVQPLSSSAC